MTTPRLPDALAVPWGWRLPLGIILATETTRWATLEVLTYLPLITLHPVLWDLSILRDSVASLTAASAAILLASQLLLRRHGWHLRVKLSDSCRALALAAAIGLALGTASCLAFIHVHPEQVSDWGPADTPIRHPVIFALAELVTVTLVPLAEELVYRAMVYPLVRRRLGPWLAIVLCAALFTLLHKFGIQSAMGLVHAVALHYAYEKRGSLAFCVAMHSGYNLSMTIVQLVAYPPWV